jgi:DnaJ-class molecular chaperone
VADDESYYETLGVPANASQEQIRTAYLKLVSEYHPDRHQANPLKHLAAHKLLSINQAYQALSDPKRRAAYDDQSRAATVTSVGHKSIAPSVTFGQRLLLTILVLLALPLLLRFGLPALGVVFRALRGLLSVL